MGTTPSMIWRWVGGVMRPLNPDRARQEFEEGQTYRLDRHEDRSEKSHRHFFGVIKTSWENLPEHLCRRFPSEEHLRRHCLIFAGYCKQRIVTCGSKAAAVRVAVLAKELDEYCIVDLKGDVVVVYTAESQSEKAMGSARFQASKEAVFDEVAKLIGVDPTTLRKVDQAA